MAIRRSHSERDRPRVLLAGNPNAGKTTVFNRLCGTKARVGNYPGITVERLRSDLRLPSGRVVDVTDLPGTYSLTARSPEEQIAAESVLAGGYDLAVVVVDATTLSRSLYLTLQILETGIPVVLALNMMDEAAGHGLAIDAAALGERLNVPVVPMTAATGAGTSSLLGAIERALDRPTLPPAMRLACDGATERDIADLERCIAEQAPEWSPAQHRAWACWLLLSIEDCPKLHGVPESLAVKAREQLERARLEARDLDLEIIAARYQAVDEVTRSVVHPIAPKRRRLSQRFDAIATHPLGGLTLFAAVLLVLFEALFSWSEPGMELVEMTIAGMQRVVGGLLGSSILRDLLVDGLLQGVGNVLVFIPQIALLFIFIAILEDSGYLARVAFIVDPIMSRLGLHGKAFVPLLSGFACAVPAILATRTIENRRDRLITMLALPLMSCSARLPVYMLVISTVFAGGGRILGVINSGAAMLFAMYCFSVLATLGAAAVLGRTVLRGVRPALVLELPPYRLPMARNVLLAGWQNVKNFLRDAGTIILAATIVLWGLLSFPRSDEIEQRYAAHVQSEAHGRTESNEAEVHERLAALDRQRAAEQLEYSAAGRMGKWVEPALEPLGFDWRIGVGIFGSFAAREVFVSTLAMVFGLGDADEDSVPLRQALVDARRPDGAPLFTPLSGLVLMIFFVLACQCISTLAVVRRESGSWKWPFLLFMYMSALAYGCAWALFQIGSALGWG